MQIFKPHFNKKKIQQNSIKQRYQKIKIFTVT